MAIDATLAGHGHLVLVQGPVARRRLDEAERHAARARAHVTRVRCAPRDVPLAPWTRIVNALAPADSIAATQECSRFERFAQIVETLGAATRDVPAVVVLDDLHHADRESLLVLEMLARVLSHWALAVVASYRDVSVSPGNPLAESLVELGRERATMHLALRAVRSSQPRTGAAVEDAVFRRVGDVWTIAFQGEAVRLRDSHGLRYLAPLLRHPWQRIQVTALHAAVESRSKGRRPEPVSAERARLAVTKAIKGSLSKIALVHPALARHLGATVRRGHFCSYTPDPRHPVAWDA